MVHLREIVVHPAEEVFDGDVELGRHPCDPLHRREARGLGFDGYRRMKVVELESSVGLEVHEALVARLTGLEAGLLARLGPFHE